MKGLPFAQPGSRQIYHPFLLALVVLPLFLALCYTSAHHWPTPPLPARVKAYRQHVLDRCQYTRSPAGPPPHFHSRAASDRFVPGTAPVLIKNAKFWTGARNGTEIIFGDALLDKGIIKALGYIPPSVLSTVQGNVQVVDANGSWVTPGLVDLHSHLGVYSSPELRGARDGNSSKSPILPWLRSIDALNTHDAAYELAISGGVTTAQILPGSANSIGGQAFVMKLRPTAERSPTSMLVEPPYTLNGSHFEHALTPRWRHMKHACGENPSRAYAQTRMDSAWGFRHAYNEARKIKEAQDRFCEKAEAGLWRELGELGDDAAFPEDLQWEALVDVLRGKVKLSIHCYEAVDLDGIVRLSNEFQFPVASFHHAGETYLVPDLLKKTWGGVPSIALFASNARKKREAYRGSEFAPRILASHGIPVVMKSDHPVVNSRYLLFEAALVHYYGFDPHLALASVTSVPAAAAGLGHRMGSIKEGYDADIVIWDSHPLALGATPAQVYIDGIPQLSAPAKSAKPEAFQVLPRTPDFDREAKEAVEWEGLPPLDVRKREATHVTFTNVKSLYTRAGGAMFADADEGEEVMHTVVISDGSITCAAPGTACLSSVNRSSSSKNEVVDLKGGALAPGLTTFGSPIGLSEIRLEPSTNDGVVHDPLLTGSVPSILGDKAPTIRAVDGLQFGSRNALLAYRAGVTTSIVAPVGAAFFSGLSTAIGTGARHALEEGAVVQDETALHVAISHGISASVSTQVAVLRKLLLDADDESLDAWARVKQGIIPLVVEVQNADIIATLLRLKAEVEDHTGHRLRLTLTGAAEAHLLAKEIGEAGVSVVLASARPYPTTWDHRRILPGPPLSYESSVTTLLSHNVNVAIGVIDEYTARNTRLDLAWAALESDGRVSKAQALALATTNLESALGLEWSDAAAEDLVVYEGGDVFDFESKVVGVVSARRGVVDLF
ncbi:hypothetical protein PLICRDRAFT_40029 [Plicaturopsis crispa FD-325 SS-3]|nr:hypothetical protein PLICRDRAFT_40029 [Plicaturopsis crispa FD-325 SS-3]